MRATHHTTRKEEHPRQAIHNEYSNPWNRRHILRHGPNEGVDDSTSADEDGEAELDWTDRRVVPGFGEFGEVIGGCDGEGKDDDGAEELGSLG